MHKNYITINKRIATSIVTIITTVVNYTTISANAATYHQSLVFTCSNGGCPSAIAERRRERDGLQK